MTCTLEKQSNILDEKSKKTIKKALKALGKKNIAFIMHNGSFPAAQNQNTGFGSIIAKEAGNLSNMHQGCSMQYSSDLQEKPRDVTLLLIQGLFFQITRCLLT